MKRFLFGICVLGLLTGCASLTVDVDVYKGPLANHPDVQLEQTAVMAIGARPILERLKSQLDKPDGYGKENELVDIVDQVLGLYESKRIPGGLGPLLTRGLAADDRYERAYGILNRPTDPVWEKVSQKVSNTNDATTFQKAYDRFFTLDDKGYRRKGEVINRCTTSPRWLPEKIGKVTPSSQPLS